MTTIEVNHTLTEYELIFLIEFNFNFICSYFDKITNERIKSTVKERDKEYRT